jgi:kynurenine formamidase
MAPDGAGRPAVIDITGPVRPGMWHYADPYFAPVLSEIRQPDWLDDVIYSEAISMPLQTGTYIETAAHVDASRERIDEVPLERTVLVPAITVQVPAGRGGCIDRGPLEQLVKSVTPPPYAGMALLVGTGWSARWDEEDYVSDGPYFSPGAIEFVVEAGFGILGGDFPRFDNPAAPTGHLRRLFETEALLLAPLYGLDRVGNAAGSLIAAPLRIENASATPVRAVWVGDG